MKKTENTREDGFAQLLIRMPQELKARAVERAESEHVSLNALANSALETRLATPLPPAAEIELSIQHDLARRVLPHIFAAEQNGDDLKYSDLLRLIERNPRKEGRLMGNICDLLDAASVWADRPLISLWRVKNAKGEHNPDAFVTTLEKLGAADPEACAARFRKKLFDQARRHEFTDADQRAIEKALDELRDMGNRKAWDFVIAHRPDFAKALREAAGEKSHD